VKFYTGSFHYDLSRKLKFGEKVRKYETFNTEV